MDSFDYRYIGAIIGIVIIYFAQKMRLLGRLLEDKFNIHIDPELEIIFILVLLTPIVALLVLITNMYN